MKMILGSASPRRKELLVALGFAFEVDAPFIEEKRNGDTPEEIVMGIVKDKGAATHAKHPDSLIVCADTIVVVRGEILEKPIDDADAFRMISLLQGTKHQVMTAVYVRYQDDIETFLSIANVVVDAMSDEEIQVFIDTKESKDKAGAYGIQGHFFRYVREIEGDFYAIMGLPSNQTLRTIQQVIKRNDLQ